MAGNHDPLLGPAGDNFSTANNTPISPPMEDQQPSVTPDDADTDYTLVTSKGQKRLASKSPPKELNKNKVPKTSETTQATQPPPSRQCYTPKDPGPFVVHIQLNKTSSGEGTTLNPVKFGQYLCSHNINGLKQGGVTKIGRNRISLDFVSATAANKYLESYNLESMEYSAFIPSFNIQRMCIIRRVPKDLSNDEIASGVITPQGFGKVTKARRLSVKKKINDVQEWIPTETVALTIDGQKLPQRVFLFHNSFVTEKYNLPVIQCFQCCRFGHVKANCRSQPRCSKCGQPHLTNECPSHNDASCLFCSGSHLATDKACPEYDRQHKIKSAMTDEAISFMEASQRFPPSRRTFAEVLGPKPPPSVSYKKTITITRKPRSPLPQGYDRRAHNAIVDSYRIPPPRDGCALPGMGRDRDLVHPSSTHDDIPYSPSATIESRYNSPPPEEGLVNDRVLDSLLSTVIMLLSLDRIPSNVASKIETLCDILNKRLINVYGGSMECA
jgi:hypothetical protein